MSAASERRETNGERPRLTPAAGLAPSVPPTAVAASVDDDSDDDAPTEVVQQQQNPRRKRRRRGRGHAAAAVRRLPAPNSPIHRQVQLNEPLSNRRPYHAAPRNSRSAGQGRRRRPAHARLRRRARRARRPPRRPRSRCRRPQGGRDARRARCASDCSRIPSPKTSRSKAWEATHGRR